MAQAKKADINKELTAAAIPNHESLKAVLLNHKHVDVVYLNDEGEWHFNKKEGFTPFTREDILNG
jgi:acetylornithine deacetylase/succinyl-diaminopimelate desuccinylase-like protein